MSKDDILKLVRRLPDNATQMDVMEDLHFQLRVGKGMKDVAEDRVITHAQLRDRIAQWRESAGR